MKEKIERRLEKAISNLDSSDFVVSFPLILDDLKYILGEYKSDTEKMSDSDQYEYGIVFNEKVLSYMGKLATIYFKEKYGLDINIIKKEDYSLAMAAGGYSDKDDNIYYSYMGTLLSKSSDLSFLHTCLHEGRHKIQHKFYETSHLLSFPPYMLALLKEHLLEDSLDENNREFYRNNYNLLFVENDAEAFAKNELANFVVEMARIYMYKSNKSMNEMGELLGGIKTLNNMFLNVLEREQFNIENGIVRKIYNGDVEGIYFDMNGEKVDRLIAMDKHVKSHPELQARYPVLRFLFNGDTPKDYDEIMIDKAKHMEGRPFSEQQRIGALYGAIISLDPILSLTDKLAKNDVKGANDYMDAHPKLAEEYPDEVKSLGERFEGFNFGVKH